MKDRPNENWANLSEDQRARRRQSVRKWRYKDPAKSIHMNVRLRAVKKGIPFNIDVSDIAIPEFCPVLGLKLKVGPGKLCANSPSLDRIFPELGYVKGNVIVISNKANMIKSNATPEEIALVAEFYKRLYREQSEIAQAA